MEADEDQVPHTAITAPTPAVPTDNDDADVVDATTILDAPRLDLSIALRRRWFNNNESSLLRLLGPKMVAANVHYFVKGVGGSKLTLHCNGAGCVLCMARHRATPTFMIPVLFVEDHEIAIILVDQNGGPESLRGLILPLLRRPDLTDLVVEITRVGNRHSAQVIRNLSEVTPEIDDYGTDVIRDVLARGALKPKAIRATVEQRDNQALLADLDWLAPKLRLFHPGLNLASL